MSGPDCAPPRAGLKAASFTESTLGSAMDHALGALGRYDACFAFAFAWAMAVLAAATALLARDEPETRPPVLAGSAGLVLCLLAVVKWRGPGYSDGVCPTRHLLCCPVRRLSGVEHGVETVSRQSLHGLSKVRVAFSFSFSRSGRGLLELLSWRHRRVRSDRRQTRPGTRSPLPYVCSSSCCCSCFAVSGRA